MSAMAATADGVHPFAPTTDQLLEALRRRVPEASAQLDAVAFAAQGPAQPPQPPPKPHLEREREAQRLAVATRKADEALARALGHEQECEHWLERARHAVQQCAQEAADARLAHEQQLEEDLKRIKQQDARPAQDPAATTPSKLNLSAVLAADGGSLDQLFELEDGDAFNYSELELSPEDVDNWKQEFMDFKARMSIKKRRVGEGAAAATGRELLTITLYLAPGEKLGDINQTKLLNVGAFLELVPLPFVITADWNIPPADLRNSKWPELLGGTVRAPTNTTWTCGRPPFQILDYCLVSHSASDWVESVKAYEAGADHKAIVATFDIDATDPQIR
ncbi:unnamed protein product, partial [Prorocentrum cordatum]